MDTARPFWHGCNYPWSTDGHTIYYGLDFGANTWGSHLGVSTRRAAVADDFRAMAGLGFTVVRWFVFCDGRAGIIFDDAGIPESLDRHVFPDLDCALELAEQVGIRLVLVLLDHQWMFSGLHARLVDSATGAVLDASLPEGRAHAVLTAQGRRALLDRVCAPIVRRYAPGGARPDLAAAVHAYELMNEPDFVVEEWEQDLSPRVVRPVPFAQLADLVAEFSDLVHRGSTASTTLAAARLRNLWAWDDPVLGLDWLQVHSYPNRAAPHLDEDVFGRPASELGRQHPIVLGEFPGDGPRQHPRSVLPAPWTLADYLAFGLEGGYRGAWAWSFSGTDHYGRLPVEALKAFARAHPSLVNPRASA